MSIGALFLALSLPAAVYGLLAAWMSVKNPKMERPAQLSIYAVAFLVTVASVILIAAFVTNDFGIKYVAEYSSLGLPLAYKLSGLWAGLDGSLLFWLWILSVFAVIIELLPPFVREGGEGRTSIVRAVLLFVSLFFIILLVFQANPFEQFVTAPKDGQGLNPLLQNVFMLFHPPALYLGYVGFTVPFALAIAALVRGEEDPLWLKQARNWTIVAWIFLTIGNLLGAMWAYVELGWGGFWAWDPVENAGILPWFTATAFLHTIILQRKKGMFRLWNLSLAILTFLLTIFGTFITRSGVIKSVHSFSDVTIGVYFLIFMAIVIAASAYLLTTRRKTLTSTNRLESLTSRESAFCINNMLFLFTLAAVFIGTVFPLISEIFTGRKMEVGAPFFNQVMAPIGIAILILTGVGPMLNWGKASRSSLKKMILPSALGLISAIQCFAAGAREWFSVAVAFGAAFLIVSVIPDLVTVKNLRIHPKRYGGYLVHLGVALLFIGIAGSVYKSVYSAGLPKGKSVAAGGGYDMTLKSLDWVKGKESEGVYANIMIQKDGWFEGNFRPALFLHRNQSKPIAEVDFRTSLLRDVYVAMGGVSKDEGEIDVELTVNPLLIWVWIGGILIVIGAMIAVIFHPPCGEDRGGGTKTL